MSENAICLGKIRPPGELAGLDCRELCGRTVVSVDKGRSEMKSGLLSVIRVASRIRQVRTERCGTVS